MTILIDAHGETCGLRVEIESGQIRIYQWSELSEPDEHGSHAAHIHHTSMTLADCTRLARPRQASQHARIIDGATAYLAQWGGDEHRVGDDDRPCAHFGSYWGPLHLPHGLTRGEYQRNLGCGACGSKPVHDAGLALACAPC